MSCVNLTSILFNFAVNELFIETNGTCEIILCVTRAEEEFSKGSFILLDLEVYEAWLTRQFKL